MKAIVIQLESLTYDDDGNLSTDSASTYTWNTRNQLTGISGGTTASFVYDALGRRESKTISSTSINFLYDGLNLEQELSGTTPTVNYLTGAGIDETLSRMDSSGTYSYLTDNLGSTLALTSSAGAISTSYSYEPYGNTTASGASSTNALQYAGRENDGTGLYYYRARYYSPVYGRFISEDPMGMLGSGIDQYAYTFDNPMGYVDPTGQWIGADDLAFTIGGALVGIAGQAASDLWNGHMSDWEHYTGAAIGGAAGGEALLYTGPIGAGAAGGGISNLATQWLEHLNGKQCSYNWGSVAQSTGLGAIGGLIPGLRIPGITAGSGSFQSVTNQIVTKAENGTISSISTITAGKIGATTFVNGAPSAVILSPLSQQSSSQSCGCNK